MQTKLKSLGWFAILIAVAAWALPRVALASDDNQGVPEDEVLASQYYDVSRADNVIHITNNTENNLCAQIYVFDNFEELQECCSCFVSTNGLDVLSVRRDLLSNPSHGLAPTRGVIEIQSTLPNNGAGCAVNQGPGTPFEATIFPMLDAWITHSVAIGPTGGTTVRAPGIVTIGSEDEFQESDDDEVQEDALESQCAAAFSSGFGVCTCGAP